MEILNKIQKFIGFRQYFIYQITIGDCVYIGSTNNYGRRIQQHRKELEQGTHSNNRLAHNFKLTANSFHDTLLLQFYTHSKTKVFDVEQRYINQYSNSNEATASKDYRYSLDEFKTDLIDLILKFIFL